MLKANLYLEQADPCSYLPKNTCTPCEDFITRLEAGKITEKDYPLLTSQQLHAFKLILHAEAYLPFVPLLTTPQPMPEGLYPINEPDNSSLVIVSGNSRLTFEVLATIWAQGITPAYFLLVNCLGNTVDMAMVYGEFTPGRLLQTLKDSHLEDKVEHHHMIVPGLTMPLVRDFVKVTGWNVEAGPICAAALPLFLGDQWVFSDIL
ncbi:hypothetical protein ACFLTP_10005 [Chloroflexota bacterium]